MKKELKIFYLILAITAMAVALSFRQFSPYFKDVYNITALQRGMIEFPRELPGVIIVFIVAGFSFIGDIKLSIFAQFLSVVGIMYLGIVTPIYNEMLVFIFINSLGFHLFGTLRKSIGLALASDENIGTTVGRYNGLFTAFTMVGSGLAYIGFKTGFFSFTTKIKTPFIVSGLLFMISISLLIYLSRKVQLPKVDKKVNFIIRSEYKYYYILVILFGVQKQIMLVYGPWVLLDILDKGASTMAVISFVGSFIGMFFIPFLGVLTDKLGLRKVLFIDAYSFIFVYVSYGLLVTGFVSGGLGLVGIPVLLAYTLVVFDRMSSQMGMVRTVYLKSILVVESDITPSLSLGMSLDHMFSIAGAIAGGFVWHYVGPQYVFYIAAAISLMNVYIAYKVK